MLKGLFVRRVLDVLFISSSPIDEVYIRSTALQCHSEGLTVEVAVCGDSADANYSVPAIYREVGIKVRTGISLSSAARIRCQLVVTASSGLNREIFPTRARCFIHMPHSLASLHMIYPAEAFDGYDVLFAAGPHHMAEFSAIAEARGLRPQTAYAVGYGKLDLLAQQLESRGKHAHERPQILVAPSWGPDNLLESCGVDLALALLAAGFEVVVRPHPLFFLDNAPILDSFYRLQQEKPGLRVESPFHGDCAIFEADILISDYSGIGFEFAALRGRPVISVDVGLKVANTFWQDLGLEPVEIGCRDVIGAVAAPVPSNIVKLAQDLTNDGVGVRPHAMNSFLYGRPGECAKRATDQIQELLRLEKA